MEKMLCEEIIISFIANKGYKNKDKKLNQFKEDLIDRYKTPRHKINAIVNDIDDWYAHQSKKRYFLK